MLLPHLTCDGLLNLIQKILLTSQSLVNNDAQSAGTALSTAPRYNRTFDWPSLTPSQELVWHDCYEGFECARLQVPMDWQNKTNPDTVELAVIRLPAVVSRSDSCFGGSILVNPGGPGGSGVGYLRWGGREMRANIDGVKHFELVSWDPRGAGDTTPSAACLDDLTRQSFQMKLDAVGHADQSDYSMRTRWAMAQSFVAACNKTIHRYATTFLVVHDMLAIVNALSPEEDKPLLNYWGFSYGTYLGNTFASVFPHRIGRVVLDGVVDALDYAGSRWEKNLRNTPDVSRYFYDSCVDAGTNCPLYAGSSASVRAKVDNLLNQLKQQPMAATWQGRPNVITYSTVQSETFMMLYFPVRLFKRTAQSIADLLEGNTTSFASRLPVVEDPHANITIPPLRLTNNSVENEQPFDPKGEDVVRVIACGDGASINNRTLLEHEEYITRLLRASQYGGLWADLMTFCAQWPDRLRPADRNRFVGPFQSRLEDYHTNGRPILWIGNHADPVTPISNARAMAKYHEGSVVLEVDQYGHCTGPMNSNGCAYGVVSKFFNTGVLPKEGKVCSSEQHPWSHEVKMTGV